MTDEFREIDFSNASAAAFKRIEELTRDELADELADYYRSMLSRHRDDCLRKQIVRCRVEEYEARLIREAGITDPDDGMCTD